MCCRGTDLTAAHVAVKPGRRCSDIWLTGRTSLMCVGFPSSGLHTLWWHAINARRLFTSSWSYCFYIPGFDNHRLLNKKVEGWCGWGSVRVKGASHWPAPLCMDLLLYLQLYTSAVWYVEFLWGQCCRQQVFVCVWGGSPNNQVQVSAGAQCPVSSTPPPTTRVSER